MAANYKIREMEELLAHPWLKRDGPLRKCIVKHHQSLGEPDRHDHRCHRCLQAVPKEEVESWKWFLDSCDDFRASGYRPFATKQGRHGNKPNPFFAHTRSAQTRFTAYFGGSFPPLTRLET